MSQNPKGTLPQTPPAHGEAEPDLFRMVVEAAPNAMIAVREDGTILLVNQAAQELFGYQTHELVGTSVEHLVPSGLRSTHREHRADFLGNPVGRPMGSQRDLCAVTRSGKEIPVEIGLGPLDTPGGLVVICAIVDLSARKELERDLAKGAALLGKKNELLLEAVMTDGLTSLRNRQAFMDHLTSQLEISVRHARPLSVLILDVDRFKDFNDEFGHLAGDGALVQIATILRQAVRRSDFVARLGGEEFGIILPETGEEGARILAERFRAAIEAADWPLRSTTASIGAMTVAFDGPVPRPATPELSFVLGEADRALYMSKELGRNRVTHAADHNAEE